MFVQFIEPPAYLKLKRDKINTKSCGSVNSLRSNLVLTYFMITGNKLEMLFETKGCTILDTGCMENVAGRSWLESYKEMLMEQKRKEIILKKSMGKVFKFGNEKRLKSLGECLIPVVIADKSGKITLDVIEVDIPLILLQNTM